MNTGDFGTMPAPFDLDGPSFSALLRRHAPETLTAASQPVEHVEGTTIVALTYGESAEGARGVVMAGDRRATAGNVISKRDMRKVFECDSWSAMGISGAAGPAMELARIFATELEHYEKVEGNPLSLDGKANKLAQMIRANLPLAMQGLVVVPLFAGYDPRDDIARIYEFDAAGGRYEERRFATTGSGGRDARGSLKARYHEDLDRDAADEDSATGGPDLVRGIYPLVAIIDGEGYRELDDAAVAERVQSVIDQRRTA